MQGPLFMTPEVSVLSSLNIHGVALVLMHETSKTRAYFLCRSAIPFHITGSVAHNDPCLVKCPCPWITA